MLNRSEPYETILDAASAGDKNRHLFTGKEYHGVDIDSEMISNALKKHHEDAKSFFYVDDITNLQSKVLENEFDLVVSTNTLEYVPAAKISIAIENLVKRVKQNGNFILQCPRKSVIPARKFHRFFRKMDYYPYRCRFGGKYERMLAKIYGTPEVGSLGTKGNVRLYRWTRPLLLHLSHLLSKIDFIGGSELYIFIFENKR